MTLEGLKEISRIQLEIMDEVHRICTQNQITYYIVYGTLLGAVRHKGFIPWDLDIDVAMPREDYERFKCVCQKDLNREYTYLDYQSFQNYMRPHALICHNGTRLHIKYDSVNKSAMELGVYVDIFPLDNAPDSEHLRSKHQKVLKRIRHFKDRRLPYCYSFNRWKRFVHCVISALLSWVSVPKLNAYQQKQMQKYRGQDTGYICSMGSGYAYSKECMARDIYGKPALLEFEGRHYYAPEKYTDYLKRMYGDYMCLPPEEERQANLEIFTSVDFL